VDISPDILNLNLSTLEKLIAWGLQNLDEGQFSPVIDRQGVHLVISLTLPLDDRFLNNDGVNPIWDFVQPVKSGTISLPVDPPPVDPPPVDPPPVDPPPVDPPPVDPPPVDPPPVDPPPVDPPPEPVAPDGAISFTAIGRTWIALADRPYWTIYTTVNQPGLDLVRGPDARLGLRNALIATIGIAVYLEPGPENPTIEYDDLSQPVTIYYFFTES
jgi:hypothetical protein